MSKYLVSPVKRFRVLKNIQSRMDRSNQLGSYRYIGEWGARVQKQHESCIKNYNKLRFFWQPPKHINSTCVRCTWISKMVVILFILIGLTSLIHHLYF